MKYITGQGVDEYPCTVYHDRGRYFVDFHATAKDGAGNRYPLPIHSYETLQGAKEAIFYHYN